MFRITHFLGKMALLFGRFKNFMYLCTRLEENNTAEWSSW